jgi:hypothetical protein
VFEKCVLRRAYGSKREAGENCIMRNFIIYLLPDSIRLIKSRGIEWTGNVESTSDL